jgi:hypothetical protein
MKKFCARTMFVVMFPLLTICIIASVILVEIGRALGSIWLELRMEFGGLRNVWKRLQ